MVASGYISTTRTFVNNITKYSALSPSAKLKPAKIFMSFDWDNSISAQLSKTTFQRIGNDKRRVMFQLPVTPETVKIDMGNEVETNTIVQTGEVVLPRYKKAVQVRFESLFPFDATAPYVSKQDTMLDKFKAFTKNGILGTQKSGNLQALRDKTEPAMPTDYFKVFEYLAKKKLPLAFTMTFYDGGHIETKQFTISAFDAEPENNGDYKYNIALAEWTDIKPRLLNDPTPTVDDSIKCHDSFVETAKDSELWWKEIDTSNIQNVCLSKLADLYNIVYKSYGTVSKGILDAVLTYNGIKSGIFYTSTGFLKLKGTFSNFAGKVGIGSNMAGTSKISSVDTSSISTLIKQIDTAKFKSQLASSIETRRQQNLT